MVLFNVTVSALQREGHSHTACRQQSYVFHDCDFPLLFAGASCVHVDIRAILKHPKSSSHACELFGSENCIKNCLCQPAEWGWRTGENCIQHGKSLFTPGTNFTVQRRMKKKTNCKEKPSFTRRRRGQLSKNISTGEEMQTQ